MSLLSRTKLFKLRLSKCLWSLKGNLENQQFQLNQQLSIWTLSSFITLTFQFETQQIMERLSAPGNWFHKIKFRIICHFPSSLRHNSSYIILNMNLYFPNNSCICWNSVCIFSLLFCDILAASADEILASSFCSMKRILLHIGNVSACRDQIYLNIVFKI